MLQVSRRLIGRSLVALGDQAILSGISLAVGLVFVASAPKDEFGLYNLLIGALALTQALQNAIVLSPMTTLIPRVAAANRWQAISQVGVIHFFVATGVALVGGVAWFISAEVSHRGGLGVLVAVSLALAVVGVWLRDWLRYVFLVQHDQLRMLCVSAAFAAALGIGMGLLVSKEEVAAANVLLAISAACALAVGLGLWMAALRRPALGRSEVRAIGEEFWTCGRWALPSVLVSWIYLNGMNFVLAWLHGSHAVADFNAARLLLMPLGFLIMAWSNVFRPRGSQLFAEGQVTRVFLVAGQSVLVLGGCVVLYSALVMLSLPLLERTVLGDDYRGLSAVSVAWAVYFLAVSVRSVWMACLLLVPHGYQLSFRYNVIAAIIGAPIAVLLAYRYMALGAVCGLILIEVLQVWLYRSKGIPRLLSAPS